MSIVLNENEAFTEMNRLLNITRYSFISFGLLQYIKEVNKKNIIDISDNIKVTLKYFYYFLL